jgi:hypothetical protein
MSFNNEKVNFDEVNAKQLTAVKIESHAGRLTNCHAYSIKYGDAKYPIIIAAMPTSITNDKTLPDALQSPNTKIKFKHYLDPSNKEDNKKILKFKEIDDHLGSDEFRSKNFVNDDKEYTYKPCLNKEVVEGRELYYVNSGFYACDIANDVSFTVYDKKGTFSGSFTITDFTVLKELMQSGSEFRHAMVIKTIMVWQSPENKNTNKFNYNVRIQSIFIDICPIKLITDEKLNINELGKLIEKKKKVNDFDYSRYS